MNLSVIFSLLFFPHLSLSRAAFSPRLCDVMLPNVDVYVNLGTSSLVFQCFVRFTMSHQNIDGIKHDYDSNETPRRWGFHQKVEEWKKREHWAAAAELRTSEHTVRCLLDDKKQHINIQFLCFIPFKNFLLTLTRQENSNSGDETRRGKEK